MSMEAKQTPLIELLERVPRDAVLVVEHDQFSSSSHPVGRLCHEAAAALRAARKIVAWARPLYATGPAEGWEQGEVVDIEFHNRAEKPEGEGWRPLVFADTGGSTEPLPRINVKPNNTLLIAAAPELLAALKKVAQSLEWHAHGRCRGFDDDAPLPTSEAVELAERTLAKVRA